MEGRVTLNGRVVTDPRTKADPLRDHIKVDGKLLPRPRHHKSYYVFNKPRHVVCTFSDPEGRPCIGDFVKTIDKRLFTVGRLDFDAEGLMILTDDGGLAEKLTHPSRRIPRTYLVKVRGNPDETTLSLIRRGMDVGDGDKIGDVAWTVVKRQKTSTWIRLVIHEGKKNEIKRIFNRIRHPVRKIRRIGLGPFSLGKLPTASWRRLTRSEAAGLASLLR